MFCLLCSPKQKFVKFHAQRQIGKSHVIDIFTSEDMENISLCIFQYLTLYYIINIIKYCQAVRKNPYPDHGPYFPYLDRCPGCRLSGGKCLLKQKKFSLFNFPIVCHQNLQVKISYNQIVFD
jgi:hypothetical protein